MQPCEIPTLRSGEQLTGSRHSGRSKRVINHTGSNRGQSLQTFYACLF